MLDAIRFSPFGRRRSALKTLAAITMTAVAAIAIMSATAPDATSLSPVAATASLGGCTPSNVEALITKWPDDIYAQAGFFNCSGGGDAKMTLQRSRWFGWETMKSWSGNFRAGIYQQLVYRCKGTGTYTYRTTMAGETVEGLSWFRQSGQHRWSC
jgi:hypothetical protein